MANNDRSSAFELNPSDRRFARLDVNRTNPDVRAVLTKLVSDRTIKPSTVSGNRALQVPNDTFLKKISDSTAARVSDSESLFQLLPDTQLAMEILISSILSPKDMVNTDLTFTVETGSLETELVGAMLKFVEEYFDKSYKIKKILTPILQDVLFLTGSYPLLILPENTIDDAINSPQRVSIESLRETMDSEGNLYRMGLLGPSKKPPQHNARTAMEALYGDLKPTTTPINARVSFEREGKSLDFDPQLTVVDNFSILKLPILKDKIRQDRIQDILSIKHTTAKTNHHVSLEDDKNKRNKPIAETTAEVEASLYRKRRYRIAPVFSLVPNDMLDAKPVGHPMVMKLPSESVIPVHVPSNPDEHIGYFLMLDDYGNPVVKAQTADYYTDMTTNINTNRDMVSQLIATTRRAEKGRIPNDRETDQDIVQAYADLVEEDLLNRLKNGIYGDGVAISRPQEVYRVMLSRALAKMQTKLLYVPADLMTYIAFDYNRFGIGASLLEKGRILGSIRSIMLFASTMSMIKNSVAREQLNITLDPNDKDPTKTVEFLIHEYAKTRQASYPVGASNPLDIINFLQNAAVQVAVTGNTGYPETKFEVEDKASNKTMPNTELMEELRNQYIMSLGLSPETVLAGANAEFATTIVTQNLLLTKRVLQYQEKLCGFIEDHIQKYIMYSGYLMDGLREVVRENKSSVVKAKKEAEEKEKQKQTEAEAQSNPTAGSEEEAGTDDTGTTSTQSDKNETKANASATLITEPDKIDKEKYGEDAIIIEFIKALRVALPSPDTASVEAQMKAFDAYNEALDKALKAYLDASFLNDTTMGELAPAIESTVAVARAYFQRQWLRSNNVLPELDVLTNMGGEDDDTFNLLEAQDAHLEGLMTSVGEFMKALREKQKEKQILADQQLGESSNGQETGNQGAGEGQGQGAEGALSETEGDDILNDLGGLDEGSGGSESGTQGSSGASATQGEGGETTSTGESTPEGQTTAASEETETSKGHIEKGQGEANPETGKETSLSDQAAKEIKEKGSSKEEESEEDKKKKRKKEGKEGEEEEDEEEDDQTGDEIV